MTAQVSDTVDLDGERYAIAGVAGSGLFDPAAYGLATPPMSTGCWRGHVCHYAATDALRLASLSVSRGSSLDGVPVSEGATVLGATVTEAGGEYVLAFADLVVPFTGTLLAGADFVQSTYVHMGYTPAWKFARVVEVAVAAGVVTGRRDLSAEMAEVRGRVEADAAPDPDGDRADPGWIRRTFGLGYDRTFREPQPPRP